jgi:tetratricopeptide (TPR) repeat protein
MDKDELIQKYLFNRLSSEEKLIFDDLMQSDKSFKNEVIFQKDTQVAFSAIEDANLKTELHASELPKKIKLNTKWLVAASILLLFSIVYLMLPNNTNNEDLFSQNFEPYRNVLHPVVRGEKHLTKIEEAFVYYENKDFLKFIEIMDSANYSNVDYNFYIANAYLAINYSKEAILILRDYLDDKYIKFKIKAQWYLALAYIKSKDFKNAKIHLNRVIQQDLFKSKEAQKLINQLH